MKSALFVPRPGTSIEFTLSQIGEISAFKELTALGSMARAAIRGSYSYDCFPVYDHESDLRDIDIAALRGIQARCVGNAAFWNGPHHIDVMQHVMLSTGNVLPLMTRSNGQVGSTALSRPLPALRSVTPITRLINERVGMQTLPMGVQAALDTVGSWSDKYAQPKTEFAEFAQAMRMRATTPPEEFPDGVIAEVLKEARWGVEHTPRATFVSPARESMIM